MIYGGATSSRCLQINSSYLVQYVIDCLSGDLPRVSPRESKILVISGLPEQRAAEHTRLEICRILGGEIGHLAATRPIRGTVIIQISPHHLMEASSTASQPPKHLRLCRFGKA